MQNIPTIIANWGLCFAASFCLLAGAAEAQTQTFTDPQFVTANYFAVLGRTPDWTGWAYWYGLLDAAPGHQSIGRPAVSSGLISSSEYYGKCQSRLPGTTVYSYGVDANGKAEALTNSGNYGWKPDPNGLPPSCPENSSYTIGWFPHNDDFVTLLYLEAVNREPDTAGWIYYYCSLVSTQACSSLLGWPPGYAASTEGETVDNFIAAGTEFVTDWGESYTVIPTSAIANPTSLGNNIWQTVTVAYSSSGGVSAIASGTVFVGTGDPTTYGSSLNGCEILWASSGQAATLYEIYNNGTPTKWSGTMQTGGTIGGSSVCSLDLRNSGYNPVTGTLTLTLLYLNTMSGQQTVWSYGADAQGWPTLPGVSLAVFTVGAPSITSVSPPNPSIGTPTTVSGTNFYAQPTVYFGGTQASPTTWSLGASGSANVNVPCVLTPGSAYQLRVSVNGITSAPYGSNFVPALATVNTPGAAPVGTPVTITGSNFGSCWGNPGFNGSVTFNNVTANVNSWSDSQINVTVPATLTIGAAYTVYVIVNGISVWSPSYFYPQAQAIVITSVSPNPATIGTSITISGSNFPLSGTVQFNGDTAVYATSDATRILVSAPPNAISGSVTVSTSNAVNLQITPLVTSFSLNTGPAGMGFTITGTGFGAQLPQGVITLNNQTMPIVNSTSTSLVVQVPGNTGLGQFTPVLKVNNVSAAGTPLFTVVNPFGCGQ